MYTALPHYHYIVILINNTYCSLLTYKRFLNIWPCQNTTTISSGSPNNYCFSSLDTTGFKRSSTALIPFNIRCSAIIGIIFYAGLLAIISTALSMNTSLLSAAVLYNAIQLKSILLAPLGWMLALACASFWLSREHKVNTIIKQPTLNPARLVRLSFCFLGLLIFETRTQ